ncbi:MAG: hypothetical protein WDZ79_00865 [Candidatus Paceibacterota bacterium]
MTPQRRHSKPHQRRRRRRIVRAGVLLVLCVGIVAGSAYLSGLDLWTINTVEVHGTEAILPSAVREVAERHLRGSCLWIYPKRNVLLYPRTAMRRDIVSAFPRIGGLDISLDGLSKLSITVSERHAYGMWCKTDVAAVTTATGTPAHTEGAVGEMERGSGQGDERCYFLDEGGFMFAPAATFSDEVYITFYSGKVPDESDQHRPDSNISSDSSDQSEPGSGVSPDAPTGPIGTTYLGDDFLSLRTFLERLVYIDLVPRSVHEELSNDLRIELEGGSYIMISLENSLDATLENIRLLIDTPELGLTSGSGGHSFEYIDMRFGNRVFYKPRE